MPEQHVKVIRSSLRKSKKERQFLERFNYTLKNTEGAIKNGNSEQNDIIVYTRRR